MQAQLKAAWNDGAQEEELSALRERIRLLEAVIDNFPGGILLTDQHLEVVLCNRQQRALLDYPDSLFDNGPPSLAALFRFNAARGEYGPGDIEEIVAAKMELVGRREAHVVERRRPNGQIVEIRGVPLAGGGFVTTYVDVTEHRKALAMIQQLALKDPLTGLANRNLLRERIHQANARLRRDEGFAILYLDLDGFKPVNDRHGHEAGDQLLAAVAEKLQGLVREMDTVARIGGDEFVILQSDVSSDAQVTCLAERILASFAAPWQVAGVTVTVGTSIGGVRSGPAAEPMERLLNIADRGLYQSKTAGKNRFTFGTR